MLKVLLLYVYNTEQFSYTTYSFEYYCHGEEGVGKLHGHKQGNDEVSFTTAHIVVLRLTKDRHYSLNKGIRAYIVEVTSVEHVHDIVNVHVC